MTVQQRLWEITERGFQPQQLNHYETLFTVGNGYLGVRGTFEERYTGDLPVMLAHGIYDHAPNTLVPDLVNLPNPLDISLTIDGTPFRLITKADDILRPAEGVVLGYERTLDMRRAVLQREVLFRAASGAVVRLVFERFASLDREHLLVQRVHITAVDGSPTISVASGINADVTNAGTRHWDAARISAGDAHIGVEITTGQSGYTVGVASRLLAPAALTATQDAARPTQNVTFTLDAKASVMLDKFSAVYTSRDTDQPLAAALDESQRAQAAGVAALLAAHEAAWARYWETADIRIDGDEEIQRALRFTTYHILIPAPRHDDRVSVGAKTLSGLGYKGHVFWDTELFIVPPLIVTHPDIARNLLMYRYHNLAGARHKAQANGCEGAMYPWESTDTGEETTPQWSDPQPDGTRIRIWTGDSEQHISTDVAYAVWQYWRWTGDEAFMRQYGAEIVLDTAVFWGSRVEERHDRYEISQQIGPDEYHENIDNSVFTNRMVVWHLTTALALLDWLRAAAPEDASRLTSALDLSDSRLARWRDIVARMYIPFDEAQQIHVQFPGFFDMEYIPVEHYTPRTTSVQAILGHARSIQTQVIKQADVVMLMALLGDQLAPRDVLLNNWHTYYPRTDHGSSLSPAIHAWVAARLGLNDIAYDMLYHAAHIDLHDNKGNVRDGIHGAACGGVWQAVVFGFCGLQIDERGELTVRPNLPAHWREVKLKVCYRGAQQDITVTNPVAVPLS